MLVSIAIAFLATAAIAEDSSTYEPVGAPANPSVEVHWDRYHDYAEATMLLKELAAAHPGYARLESIGTSFGGRELWVLTVTDFANGGDAARKPGFWIDGAIHANEIQASEVVLYTAWFLLESRPYSPFVSGQLRDHVYYLMPMMSPDSRDAHFHEPNNSSSPRSGQRPIDNDRDGLIDEDGPEDLNGDGNISLMRVKDPNGRWKESEDYPGWMLPVDPDEHGDYTLFFDEGYDNDGDGEINEDDKGGYDPNRDWPWNWQPGYIQDGAWKYPLSIDENRKIALWITAHPNIAGAQTYHNAGGMILHGPGQPTDPYPEEDNALLNFIGKKGEQMLPGYKNMRLWDELYPVWGGEIDWLYKMNGALTFTNEMFNSFSYFRREPDPTDRQANREEQRMFDKYLLFGEGYVPWTEVDHPQYGKVEVGGAKKTWGRQPPSFLLEEECHRNFAFTMYHAEQLPRLEVQSVNMRPLEGGLTEVTAVVANRAAIPTHLGIDLEHKLTRPDWVSLSSGSARFKVIAGYQGDSQFFVNNREQKRMPQRMEVTNIPGNSAVYLRWLVSGTGPFTVTADSVKGGVVKGRSPES
jgi:murein tripeptide amidase MpaA